MNCKNCQYSLEETTQFCNNCGAKVILDRLTIKKIWQEVSTKLLGWDNKYFTTIRHLITQPKEVLDGYIIGIRKKYVHPITFLGIGAALAVLVYNQFADQYLKITEKMSEEQMEMVNELIYKKLIPQNNENEAKTANAKVESLEEFKVKQKSFNQTVQKKLLQYFNIFAFLVLPMLAFLTYKVFGDPYNYAEHLVINAYIQGLLFLSGSIFFLLSVNISPWLYFLGFLTTFGYYSYAFAHLYDYSLGKVILKFFKFLGLIILVIFGTMLLGLLIGFITGFLMAKFGLLD